MIRFAMLRGALCGGLGIALRVSPPLAAVSRPSRRGGGGYFKLSVLSHTKLQERLDTMAETQTPDIIYTQVDEAPELADEVCNNRDDDCDGVREMRARRRRRGANCAGLLIPQSGLTGSTSCRQPWEGGR